MEMPRKYSSMEAVKRHVRIEIKNGGMLSLVKIEHVCVKCVTILKTILALMFV
jgi:hypothetical protein